MHTLIETSKGDVLSVSIGLGLRNYKLSCLTFENKTKIIRLEREDNF